MNSKIKFPQNEKQHAEWYKNNIEGTVDSNWGFLRDASFSAFINATEKLSQIVTNWQKTLSDGDDQSGKAWIFLNMDYSTHVSGPMLSAILLPAFSIESFFSFCAHVAFVAEGLSNKSLPYALHGFDSQPFVEKTKSILELSGASSFTRTIHNDLKELVAFRNSSVHSTPFHNIPEGIQVSVRRKKVKIAQYTTEFGRYPTYLTENLPLNLSHAMKAIEVHNSIVDHVIHNSSEIFKESFYQLLSASEIGSLQIAHNSGSFISEAEKLDKLWQETLIPWHKNVPPEAYAEYIENLQRERHD